MESFVTALAYETPVPGGGAAAAHCAACAAALMLKVVKVWGSGNAGSQGFDFHGLERRIEQLTVSLDLLVDEDSRAYLTLSDARKKGEAQDILKAISESIQPLVTMINLIREAADLLISIGSASPKYLRADLEVSIELFLAAMAGAERIVRSNLKLCGDKPLPDDVPRTIEDAVFRTGSALQLAKEALSSQSRSTSPR